MPSEWSRTLERQSINLCTQSGELARYSDKLVKQGKFLIEEIRQDMRRRRSEPKTEPYLDHAEIAHPLQIRFEAFLPNKSACLWTYWQWGTCLGRHWQRPCAGFLGHHSHHRVFSSV